MSKYVLHITMLSLLTLAACVQKPEKMVGPTIGSLDIISDEDLKYIIDQEEEIFERNYKYAKLNITYLPQLDMFRKFLADSIEAIISPRSLTKEERSFFQQGNIFPREYPFATGALAFITNKNQKDTSFTYEEIMTMFKDGKKGKVFVIEGARSGISSEIMSLLDTTALPGHFYALDVKKDVIDYLVTHDNAIGVVDWSDISDSDNLMAKEILNTINLLEISRPVDSTQFGFLKPYQYNLQDDKYPFTRDLYMISTTGMTDVGIGFASFIAGEIGQKIILKAGLLPKFQSERILEIGTASDIKVIK